MHYVRDREGGFGKRVSICMARAGLGLRNTSGPNALEIGNVSTTIEDIIAEASSRQIQSRQQYWLS